MYKIKFSLTVALLTILSMGTFASAAFAQIYTLTIQDGRVLINGKQVDENDVPSSLNIENLYLSLSFSGSMTPTFELNGRYYTLENQSLREVRQSDFPDDETTVVFRNTPTQAPAGVDRSRSYVDDGRYADQVLYQSQASASTSPDYNALMEQYVMELSQLDQSLYMQLINELELEKETQEIAIKARRLPPGDERDQHIEQLRRLLNEAFDLKQDNRRREIKQLEQQLVALQQRLKDREAMKKKIIDHRIDVLVDTTR